MDMVTGNGHSISTIKKWILMLKRRLGVRLEPLDELYLEMVLSGRRVSGRGCASVGHHAASCATLVSWLEVDDNMLNERIEMKMATVV